MEIVYWVVIGVMVALLAKVQLAADRDEPVLTLLALSVPAAVISGVLARALGHGGILGMSWVGHLSAFLGACIAVCASRVATRRHLA